MIDTDEMWDYNMGVGTDFVYILGSDEKYEQSRFRKSVAEQDSDDEECDESDSKKGDGGKKGKDSQKNNKKGTHTHTHKESSDTPNSWGQNNFC